MNIVIIGLNNTMYKEYARANSHKVITVDDDITKNPDHRSLKEVLNKKHDLAIVDLPIEKTQEAIKEIMPFAKIVVSNSILKSANEWGDLIKSHPETKLLLSKPNYYRTQNKFWGALPHIFDEISQVHIQWYYDENDLGKVDVTSTYLPHLLTVGQMLFKNSLIGQTITDHAKYNVLSKHLNVDHDMSIINFRHEKGFNIQLSVGSSFGDLPKMKWNIRFNDTSEITYMAELPPYKSYENMFNNFLKMTDDDYEKQKVMDLFVQSTINNMPKL